ncbi:hypothetical protein D3C85_1699870 [compost metagenome]
MIFILLEAQGIELAQQWLGQFAQRQHRQVGADLTLQVMQLGKVVRGLDAAVVLGGNPQCGFQQGDGLAFQAGQAGLTWLHGASPHTLEY